MGLYLGDSEKLKLILNGVVYKLNVYTGTQSASVVRLLSSDNYILKDKNGYYLSIKENNLILEESD